MVASNARVLSDYPYPIAYPCSLALLADDPASKRVWALCFTVYQAVRLLCLPLVGQYLAGPVDESAVAAIRRLNEDIARIRSPYALRGLHCARKLLDQ